MLIGAAGLDLTRCSLVLLTYRHIAPTVGLVAAGLVAAVVSLTAARGYRAGRRWAAWAALLIGVASAPQASASGFHNPYTMPDVATAALGVLLAVAVLATVSRADVPAHPKPADGPRFSVGLLPAWLDGDSLGERHRSSKVRRGGCSASGLRGGRSDCAAEPGGSRQVQSAQQPGDEAGIEAVAGTGCVNDWPLAGGRLDPMRSRAIDAQSATSA
ncbi:MAG TPA: hypothetical protein VK836_12965 [Streptosporangiaceae bacterium]|nr:hypothetical protein [Streptosporangiaceae bacterium]